MLHTTIFSGVSMTISRILSHSPSRVVACRLRLLGSVNSRFGLHRLTKRYLIVLSALTHSPDASHLPPRRPPRGHKSFFTIAPFFDFFYLNPRHFHIFESNNLKGLTEKASALKNLSIFIMIFYSSNIPRCRIILTSRLQLSSR
jgi:hypothetical protein